MSPMRKSNYVVVAALTCTLGLAAVAGCGSETQEREDVNADVPQGAPPLMPVSHEGRYELTGVNGCWGCHGTNSEGEPLLRDATALPTDHYAEGDAMSGAFNVGHNQCIVCHAQA